MPKGKKDDKPIAEEKFQQLDINAKDPRTVVLMLDSPEGAILCKACQSLQQYMEKSEQNCTEVLGLDAVPRLVKLLSSPEKVVSVCAVITLAVMVSNLAVKRTLLKLDVIGPLFKMLKPDEEVYIIERVNFIIANLAEEYTFKQHLVDENACQLLVPYLSHTDCDVVKHSIRGLSLLTTHHTARAAMATENGFPGVLAQLESEYAEIQELVLQTLEHCLHDAQCRTAFSTADGLAKITEFLNKQEWSDLHVLAVDVLSLCLVEEKGMEALHSSNCLQRLLQSIKDSQLPQMKTKAAKALASASRDDVSKKILHEQEAEKTFIDLLSSQDESVCCAACEGVKGLSTLTTSRQLFGREGGVKALVNLLQNPNGNIRCAAVQALSSVINETIANCNLVNEAGGIEGLVLLLSDDLASSRLFAAQCITSMSPSGSLRAALVQNCAMEGLAGCLSHADPSVLSSVTQGIALLGIDTSAREKFPSDGVGGLLDLVLSSNMEVCRNATWALAVLAQSRNVTEAMFNAKGADTLNTLSQESSHREVREYGKLALKRLLSSCPAAKYNITNVLTPQDVIVDTEFWDMGMAEATGFIPLDKLLDQTAVMNKPVIGVSLVNKPVPQPPSVVVPEQEEGKDDLESSSTRSKSRQAKDSSSNKSVSKKVAKDKQASERQTTPDDDSSSGQVAPSPPGLLSPDPELWEHIKHVQTNIQNLESVRAQTERLALYVSQAMGGQVPADNPLQYELPLAEVQSSTNCPIVPLGRITKGTFQHRALLYKVLSDQLGIPCSLEKGQYGRHWNIVLLENNEMLVDLMFTPSKLWQLKSPEALQYQTV